MKMMIHSTLLSVSLVFLLVLQLDAAAPAAKLKCTEKDKQETDELAAQIMTIGTTRPFPVNKEQFKAYCKYDLGYLNLFLNLT